MDDYDYVLARKNIETVIGSLKHTIRKDSEQLVREEARLAALEEQYERERAPAPSLK